MLPSQKLNHPGGELLLRVIDFVRDCRATDPSQHFPHVGDIQWWFRDTPLDDENNWRFWRNDQGKVIAIGIADSFPIWYLLHPLAHRPELEPQFCAWAMECRARLEDQSEGKPLPHMAEDVFDGDAQRIAWLKENGYVQGGRVYIRYSRDLNLPIPEPQLPEGFVIQHMGSEEIVAQRARLDYDAFEMAGHRPPNACVGRMRFTETRSLSRWAFFRPFVVKVWRRHCYWKASAA